MTADALNPVALRQYLIDNGVPVQGELTVELIAGGRSNLTFKVSDESSAWVVRRPPLGGLTPSAHDVGREFVVTEKLYGTGVPIARPVALDAEGTVCGAPLTVTEFVTGRVYRHKDDLSTLTDAELAANAAALVRVLVDLHAVDYRAVGLESFGRPDGFLERQVRLWARQWELVKTPHNDSALSNDVAKLAAALSAAIPQATQPSVVHGDFRIDNTICDPERADVIRAVVDWELSTLGDPLTDIALMCVYRSPAFDGVFGHPAAWTSTRLPSSDALAQEYARRSGRDLSDWNFYLALANFKIGVIAEGITHRAQHGAKDVQNAGAAAQATPEFIAAALKALP
ncbi:phosphotransferase family protein [Mycolicibacter hiberniae]|uniref:Acyl-CoA dehydrogenase n=1 Tax=Mycolicibacter hiberniae TaxID=29314 RepID=A0A7I7X7L2_9MYCO|nr:phosphotransferase family protein [Mycolicibacter hiberniae]MCV7087630.1 phosphotransferase family protein [Mycolicibacter hiberniae]ORV72289.1 acyl-CoA dehydrogenase [Mycolicibacter hiberniae]BBZ24847.1 acyl-CoA dehydrogenase [Mycolicibacter hiberniae]